MMMTVVLNKYYYNIPFEMQSIDIRFKERGHESTFKVYNFLLFRLIANYSLTN